MLRFSPNTTSSSGSPTDRGSWPQDADSEDQNQQSYSRKIKRSRSWLGKSKRRKTLGPQKAGTQDVLEITDLMSGYTKGPHGCGDNNSDSPVVDSHGHTQGKVSCSCTDSDHDFPANKRSLNECSYLTGSPVNIPGRKAKRRKRWNSNSDSSSASKHLSVHELSSDEMSDLEPQFIPNLTNESIELTEDEQLKNVILQFSESCLEEEVK